MTDSEEGQSDQLTEQLARRINRWGLALPAILLLEVTKPLSFVASQGLLLCAPLLSFLHSDSRVRGYAELLADRSNLEQLIRHLEGDGLVPIDSGEEKGC